MSSLDLRQQKNVDALLKRGQKVLDKLGVPTIKTKEPMPGRGTTAYSESGSRYKKIGSEQNAPGRILK